MPSKHFQHKEENQELKTNDSPDLSNLEQLLHTPVVTFNSGLIFMNLEGLNRRIANIAYGDRYAILITTQADQNLILKTWGLLYSSLYIKRLKRKLTSTTGQVLGCYGVYPYIQNPVAIYQLDNQAENYVNEFILPPNTSGLNGFLRRIIMSITKYHLSTAGVLLVLRKV